MEGKKIRIVFMGTPGFAVQSLSALVREGYNVVGVVTAPDRPAGRGRQIHQTEVKKYAVEQNLRVLQPEKLKAPEFIEELQKLKADLQVVVAFRMLPEVVWNMPRLGTFNLHASLLPKYRGAAPLNWAIMNGETESGVSTFKLQHEIDTGNIIYQEKVAIAPNDTIEVLHDNLMLVGAKLVTKTVDALAGERVQFISQSDLIAKGQKPTPAPKIFKNDCLINWNQPAENIRNFVRGLSPYPAAWTKFIALDGSKETSAKIYSVVSEDQNGTVEPGSISTDKKTYLKIASADVWLAVQEIQMAGKKRMLIEDFLRGFQQIENYKAIQ